MLKLLGQAAKNFASVKLIDKGSDALMNRYLPEFASTLSPNAKDFMSELVKRHYLYTSNTKLTVEEAAACKLIAVHQMLTETGKEAEIETAYEAFSRDHSKNLSTHYRLALIARDIEFPPSPLD